MWSADRDRLLRRYRDGDAAIEAYAEDYAFLVFGLLELFQADGDVHWLQWAIALLRAQDRLFWDDAGGWFSTTGADPSVLVRMKEEYDGAEPSASGVGVTNLLTLAHLTGERDYADRAENVFAAFAQRLESIGRALPFMASALSVAHAAPEQIVIAGARDAAETKALWQAANRLYRPFATFIPLSPGTMPQAMAGIMPWIAGMTPGDREALAYVCRNFVCEAPTSEPSALL